MTEIQVNMSPEHERAKERVIQFTDLGRVHKLIEERITNSPDGGVEINYVNREDDLFRLARVDMAKDGMVYVLFWDRRRLPTHTFGDMYDFSEEMMPVLIHRIQNFLASGRDH